MHGYMNLIDLLELFFLNCHDLKVKIPHPGVTQVVVDTQPTHCVEVLTKSSCGSLLVLGLFNPGALGSPLCRIVCQSQCVCTWALLGSGGSSRGFMFMSLCHIVCQSQCACTWA